MKVYETTILIVVFSAAAMVLLWIWLSEKP